MAFQPTHSVPSNGLRAWAAPDPAQAPMANLNPGLDLRVVERRGQWAHVEASNGWRGWVDADLLVERAASPSHPQPEPEPEPEPLPAPEPQAVTEPLTTPPVATPESQPAPALPPTLGPAVTRPAPEPPSGEALRWGLGAAVLLVFSTLLDWNRPVDVDFGGQNFSGWDFPLVFLFDFDIDSTKGVSIGLALLVVAAVAVAFARTDQGAMIWRVTGAVTLGAAGLFLVQAQRLVSDFDSGWFLDFLGPGFYLAVLAGVGLLMAPTRPHDAAGKGASTTPGT